MIFVYARSLWKRPGVTCSTTMGGIACAVGMPYALVWLKVMDMSVGMFLRESISVLEELLR